MKSTEDLLKELGEMASVRAGFSFYIQYSSTAKAWRVIFTHRRFYNFVREELMLRKNISDALSDAIAFIKKYEQLNKVIKAWNEIN